MRLAPQIGQTARRPVSSGCINVAQPLVEQNSRLTLVRRMRRRADACWLNAAGLWVRFIS
jgi:hypothetical protein